MHCPHHYSCLLVIHGIWYWYLGDLASALFKDVRFDLIAMHGAIRGIARAIAQYEFLRAERQCSCRNFYSD
jgi:hypothetical protein